jgi:hypothetical protein
MKIILYNIQNKVTPQTCFLSMQSNYMEAGLPFNYQFHLYQPLIQNGLSFRI